MSNQKTIDFAAQSVEMSKLAEELYKRILALGPKVRNDYDDKGQIKERPGLAVTAWEFGTRNHALIMVEAPIALAITLSGEKIMRTRKNGDWSSQTSEDIEALEFRGGLIFVYKDITYGIGNSGLLGDEDVLVGVCQISLVTGWPIKQILSYYDGKNELPASFFDETSYIYVLLHQLIAEQNK